MNVSVRFFLDVKNEKTAVSMLPLNNAPTSSGEAKSKYLESEESEHRLWVL